MPNNNVAGGLIPALWNASETFTRDELRAKILHGVKPQKADPSGPEPLIVMPTWREVLTDEEIGAVSDYLLSLRPGKGAGTDW